MLTDEERLCHVMTQGAVRSAAMIERMSKSGITAFGPECDSASKGFRTPEGDTATLNAQLTAAHKKGLASDD